MMIALEMESLVVERLKMNGELQGEDRFGAKVRVGQ